MDNYYNIDSIIYHLSPSLPPVICIDGVYYTCGGNQNSSFYWNMVSYNNANKTCRIKFYHLHGSIDLDCYWTANAEYDEIDNCFYTMNGGGAVT